MGSLAISRTLLPCTSLPAEQRVAILRYHCPTAAPRSEPRIMAAVRQLRIAVFIELCAQLPFAMISLYL